MGNSIHLGNYVCTELRKAGVPIEGAFVSMIDAKIATGSINFVTTANPTRLTVTAQWTPLPIDDDDDDL
jgi:hypothetical protein